LKKPFGRPNGEKGMVTIEATIALTTFLMAFLMIYSITTVCRAQARIQVALNNTAQEISQYSYIYGLSGLDASLGNFQTEANKTKADVNTLVSKTVEVFEGIQTLGDDAKSAEVGDVESMLNTWETISNDLKKTGADAAAVKDQIEKMAKDPQKLLFGMAKLIGSEALEIGKSRLIAEPVARALITKHLKRSENDTADAFCRSVGIVPGTYLGTTSYFNGIDFSNSTLFPYGSPEITLIATYKVKLLQLLPIGAEFTITQSATTRGWLHGDQSNNPATQLMNPEKEEANVEESVWNSQSVNDRNKAIRKEELEILKESGYVGVSGETYVQAYRESTNTFALIAMCNPVYGVDSVEDIDKESVKSDIKRIADQIYSATYNRKTVTVKVKDSKGNITTKKIDCSTSPMEMKVILVVPEDAGVKDYVQGVIDEWGYDFLFSVKADYGTGYKLPEKTETEEGAEK